MVIKVDHVVRVAPLLVARAETFSQAPTGLPRQVSDFTASLKNE
jgi:hypothetical protein